MPSDYLLEIEGIKGEAQDSKHKDHIEIESFTWGATHPGSFAHGMGGSTGKVSFQDISFSAKTNKASPNLMLACATGKHINKAVLRVRKATGDGGQQEYYTITFSDILVSSYQTGGSEGGGNSLPIDTFALNYSKIKFEFKPQKADGGLDPAVTGEYDIKQQKK